MRFAPDIDEKSTSCGLSRTTLPLVHSEFYSVIHHTVVCTYRIFRAAAEHIESVVRRASGKLVQPMSTSCTKGQAQWTMDSATAEKWSI